MIAPIPVSDRIGRDTWLGILAIPLWSLTPVFIVLIGPASAFALLGLRFAISGVLLLCLNLKQGQNIYAQFRQPLGLWALGLFGILFSQWIYVLALQYAPPAEANFINYLWPIYLVLLAGAMGAEKLTADKILAVGIAFVGAGIIMLGETGFHYSAEHQFGYALAMLAGFAWAVYTLCLKRFYLHQVSSIRGGPFLLYAILCFIAHAATGAPDLILSQTQWVYVLAFGIVPVGYIFWEHGVKHGQLPVLAVAAYFIPLLSAVMLHLLTGHDWSWPLLLGGGLIILAPLWLQYQNYARPYIARH